MGVQSSSGCYSAATYTVAFACLSMLLSGCGGSPQSSQAPQVPANTTVTIVAASTANDQLSQFDLGFNNLKLISGSGTAVDLLPAMEHAEFIHRNGSPEPLITTTVPEGTYTSATAQIGPERIGCMGTLPGGINRTSTADYGYTPDERVKIVLPHPINVSGMSMVLLLDLKVSQSTAWSPTACPALTSFSLTPTLELNVLAADGQRLKLHALAGLVTETNNAAGTLTIQAADGPGAGLMQGAAATWAAPKWTVAVSSTTEFTGVNGISGVRAGVPVIIDGTLQRDGTVLATHVAVADTDTQMLNVVHGPIGRVDNYQSVVETLGIQQYGYFKNAVSTSGFLGLAPFSYGNTSFRVAEDAAAANLSQLPFVPSFDQSSMVAGQAVSVTWHGENEQPAPIYLPAASVTLLPQTINGTVESVSQEGTFQKYIVVLASYDLFPQLAAEALQTSPLNDPGIVIVYADSNTESHNSSPIATGNTVRFNGLVFNDAGSLKMKCMAIYDGVPE